MKMKRSRILVCGKCQESMTAAFFVARHRTPNGAPCRTVPCDTCLRPAKKNPHHQGRLALSRAPPAPRRARENPCRGSQAKMEEPAQGKNPAKAESPPASDGFDEVSIGHEYKTS